MRSGLPRTMRLIAEKRGSFMGSNPKMYRQCAATRTGVQRAAVRLAQASGPRLVRTCPLPSKPELRSYRGNGLAGSPSILRRSRVQAGTNVYDLRSRRWGRRMG
jgi:hypothetical protein